VLPGLEAASPPIEQKSTAIWLKLTSISNFYKIPLLFRYFWSFHICRLPVPIKTSAHFLLRFNNLGMIFSQNSFKIKFRYFSANFG
jgi:hypothetical protein